MEHTVRYQKLNAKGQIVSVEKTFKTEKAMDKHLDQVQDSGNLYQVLDYLANSK